MVTWDFHSRHSCYSSSHQSAACLLMVCNPSPCGKGDILQAGIKGVLGRKFDSCYFAAYLTLCFIAFQLKWRSRLLALVFLSKYKIDLCEEMRYVILREESGSFRT